MVTATPRSGPLDKMPIRDTPYSLTPSELFANRSTHTVPDVLKTNPTVSTLMGASGYSSISRVMVLIGENGTPGEIQLAESSGSASLDEAALTTLRRWRFQAALRNGQPVLAWVTVVTVPVIFSLR